MHSTTTGWILLRTVHPAGWLDIDLDQLMIVLLSLNKTFYIIMLLYHLILLGDMSRDLSACIHLSDLARSLRSINVEAGSRLRV